MSNPVQFVPVSAKALVAPKESKEALDAAKALFLAIKAAGADSKVTPAEIAMACVSEIGAVNTAIQGGEKIPGEAKAHPFKVTLAVIAAVDEIFGAPAEAVEQPSG